MHPVSLPAALAILLLALPLRAQSAVESVIPRPESVVDAGRPGPVLDGATAVCFSGELAVEKEAQLLAAQLRLPTGLPLPVEAEHGVGDNVILMVLSPELAGELGEEGYRLEIGRGVRIAAAKPAGLFYGGQTLRQLLPAAAFAKGKQDGVKWALPQVRIQDAPRHAWRGFMLDYARHFFSMEYTKHLLDEMAARKMNVFHMHLTDDDGWRIEIKKYPKLTDVGAWRGTKCALPSLLKREQTECYGGFFTQEQIKEIVAYAAARHIQVLPEIDLPGHALALVTAYPEALPTVLSDARNDNGFGNNLLSPAKEANYEMIDGILAEVAALFPFDHVHIGGDEVDYWFWDNCPEIQSLIRRENLAGTQDLQGYFSRRVELILAKHGKKMVGWNELSCDRLGRQNTLLSWTGDAALRDVLLAGYPAVAAHNPDLSPDMLYPQPGDEPPVPGFAGPVSFQRCLEFDPTAAEVGESLPLWPELAQNIHGVEGCLWAEYIAPWRSATGWLELKTAEDAADFKMFPRLCALADLGWSRAPGGRDAFAKGYGAELARLRAAGVACRLPTPDVVARAGTLVITPPFPGAQVRYTLDGTDPLHSPFAVKWDGAPVVGHGARFVARTFVDGQAGPLCFGARPQAAGWWQPATFAATWRMLEVDVTGLLDAPGRWHLHCRRINGKHALEVGRVDILVNGRLAARNDDAGIRCPLEVTGPIGPQDKVVLRMDARLACGEEAPDSFGAILLEQAQGLAPEIEVTTNLPALSGDYGVDNLADFDPRSHFWSNRPAKKGESVLFTLDDAEELTHVECLTGVPGSLERDILKDGILEISADGKTFRQVAVFDKGAAKADFPKQRVKAVRLTVTEAQVGSWLAVQDLILK